MAGIGLIIFALTLWSVKLTLAASLNILPNSNTLAVHEEFTVDVKLDSSGQTINAAQATITFPKDIIEVTNVQKDSSIFSFWLQEPIFSNNDGTVKFIGGAQGGSSGGSLQILRINFKTKNIGTAPLSFEDAAVTAADGSGTNVLTSINGGIFIVNRGKAWNELVFGGMAKFFLQIIAIDF